MRRHPKNVFISVVLLVGLLASFTSPTPAIARTSVTGPVDPPNQKQPIDNPPPLEAAPAGVDNITGSTVNFVAPVELPTGVAFDLCFNVTVTTNDQEFLDRFDFDLPDNWTVNGVIDVPATTYCFNGHTYGVEAGNIVNWTTNGMPSECGDWLPGTYDFCANVTIPDCNDAPWSVPWDIIGDTYGSPPHSVSGAADLFCLQPDLFLTPGSLEVSGCNGAANTSSFSLFNYTGSDGTFAMNYSVPSLNGTLTGPDTITAAQGETVNFEVTFTPDLCTDPGDVVNGLIETAGNGYTDLATLNYTVVAGPIWEAIPDSAPSWGGVGEGVGDGCTAHNAAGETITYILNPTWSLGFWGYNHTTNTWFQPAPPGQPGDRYIPSWAYDPDTNLCYLTGGGMGETYYSEAYIYDPVANNFTTLPSFTSGRWALNSWVGTIDGVKYLCVGGGAGTNNVLVQATQCYDINTGAWNPENAQMGAFPTDPWAAADGILHAETGDQFWYVGGAINNWATISDEARYWDDADNAWHFAGNTGKAAYSVEGDFLNGEFYLVDGSIPGSQFSNTAVKGTFDGTSWIWTDLPNTHIARQYNVVTAADNAIWSVTGFSIDNTAYVEKLTYCPSCTPQADIEITYQPLDVEQCEADTSVITATICNTGDVDLIWNIADTADWLTEAPTGTTVLPGECTIVDITFDSTGVAPGYYTDTLVITSNDPDTPVINLPASMTVLEPVSGADFTYTPLEPITGDVIAFTGTVAAGAEPVTWDWNFGDGTIGLGQNVTHTYPATGDYLVTLTVANACGESVAQYTVTVSVPCEPLEGVDIIWEPVLPEAGEVVTFTGTFTAGTEPVDWLWDFGEGPGITRTHVFTEAGLYTVTVVAQNDCTEPITVEKQITIAEPCAELEGVDFTWTPDPAYVSGEVLFEATVMTGTEPIMFEWNFGDGTFGAGINAMHTYTATGDYTVTLEVENACDTETVVKRITITEAPPCEPPDGVSIIWTPAEILTGNEVIFTGNVVTGTEPFTFEWLISDGLTNTADITGTGQNLPVTFEDTGTYTVTLTVTNACDSVTVVANVTVKAPVYKAYLPVILKAYPLP